MNKFFFIFVFLFLFTTKAFPSIITLSNCYMTKWDGDVIYNDKVWSKKHWDEWNIIDRPITDYFGAKEFIPKNITPVQFDKIIRSCYNKGGCNEKAKEFVDKYNLRQKYIQFEDFKLSINMDTGTIIVEEIYTDDAIQKINLLQELRWKWKGREWDLYLTEQHRVINYKIINYTQDTVFSKASKNLFLNVNYKKNSAIFKIDSDSYKENSNFICRGEGSSKNQGSSTLKSILKMLN